MSSQVAGLGSSRWIPPSNQAPLRQVENVANGYAPTIKSNVRPRLHIYEPNTEKSQEQHIQTPDEPPAFIPPHLRGVNTPSKTSPSLNGPTPPNLRPMPVSVNISRENKPPAKDPVFMNIDLQNQSQQVPSHKIQTLTMPPTNLHGAAIPLIAQPPSGTKPDGGDFLSFLNKKVSAATEAKKKEIAEKVRIATQQATPWSAPNEAQSSTLPLSRNKFRPNTETDQAFQLFLRDQIQGPVTNGKKYTFTGDQQFPQALAVASTQSLNAGLTLQVQNSNRNASETPFRTVDPHSAFSPGHITPKSGPPLMFNNAEAAVDALVEPGFEPANTSEGFEDKISDSGVGVKVKENVRASQGQDPKNEFLDWDGKTWRPAPVDWETDRTAFDNGFMATYIRQDWEPSVPRGPKVEVNTKDPKFKLAVWVGETGFEAPIDHPMTIPDLAHSENQENQRHQTADTSSKPVAKKEEKRMKATQSKAHAQEKHNREVELRLEEEHPYKPKIEVYLRPATENDSKCMVDIYNYYTLNLLTTEDQGFITTEDVEALIRHSKDENLPIIVAVTGKMPLSSPRKSHQSKKVSFPQFESIIGFGYAETYGYGLGGSRSGRSRFTKSLYFFVHPDHTRLKVGQSLLDRLIQTLSHGYGAKNGYEWMDPNNDPVYQHGGVHKVHQLVIQYAIEQKNDPNYQWMKTFLRRYFFDEEGRIHGLARSQASGPGAKFADVVFFCKELAAENEFGAMI